MLIAAAGNLEHEETVRRVRAAFESLSDGARPAAPSRPREHADFTLREKEGLEQVHLCLGVPTFPQNAPERYIGYLLNTVLGGTMSSRLFQIIREDKGLAYSVFSSISSFLDTGYLMVYAATGPDQARQVIDLTSRELRRLKEEAVAAQELRDAKDHLKGSLMLSLESTSSRMSNLAKQDIYFGQQFTLEEVLAGIESVTADEVRELARRLLDPSRCTLAALGRLSGMRLERGDLAF
jgi:predicted Zn-dependent peptidase